MSGRRTFLKGGLGAAAVLAAGGSLVAYNAYPIKAWQRAVADTWQPLNGDLPTVEAKHMELVRLACLAANSHNTQPWKFRLDASALTVIPDFTRATPVVDPDSHHLYASLGCAIENIVQAAPMLGLSPSVHLPSNLQDGITIQLDNAAARPSPLAAMIHLRQSTRSNFDGKPVANVDLDALTAAATGGTTDLTLLTSPHDVSRFAKLIADAALAQMQDAAYVAELKNSIRFSYGQALATRDGLFSLCSGSPALPGPIGRALFSLVATAASESQRFESQVKASSGIAIFSSAEENPRHWLDAGRSYQRFALEATRLGLKHSFVNQPVEVGAYRAELLKFAGRSEGRADLVVRFGFGSEMPRSLRRAVAAVTVTS
jgi:hypothetical protein